MMKISVIVPIYNSEKFILKCIQSIIRQTYTNLEIILVNDGSTDQSLSICQLITHSDKRIKLIDKANGGVSSARNAAIKIADGDYIGFVDSDDWIEDDMYEVLLNNLLKNNCDLSVCEYQNKVASYDNKIYYLNKVNSIRAIFNTLDTGNIGSGLCNKIFKTVLIRENNLLLNENITIGEDLLFLCNYINVSSSVCFISSLKYHYTMNLESATKSNFKASDLTIFDAYETIELMWNVEFSFTKSTIAINKVEWCLTYILKIYNSKNNSNSEIDYLLNIIKSNIKIFMKSKDTNIKQKLYCIFAYINPRLFYYLWRITKKIITNSRRL